MYLDFIWNFYEPINFKNKTCYFKIYKNGEFEIVELELEKIDNGNNEPLRASIYFRCMENGIYLEKEKSEDKNTAFRIFVPKEYKNNILLATDLTSHAQNWIGEEHICSVIVYGTPELLKGKPIINRINVPLVVNFVEHNGKVGWSVEQLDNAERDDIQNEYLVNLQMSILEPVLADAKDKAKRIGSYSEITNSNRRDEDSEDFGSFENIDPDNNKVIWEYQYCGNIYDLTSNIEVAELVSKFEDKVEEWDGITDRNSDEWLDCFYEYDPTIHIVIKATLGEKVNVEYSYYLHYNDGIYGRVLGSADGKTIKLDGKNIDKLVEEFAQLI